jgi:deoxyribose-phosphate aldolase
MFTLKEISKMIDHSLLHPTMTDADLRAGCELAKKYDVASVCIKPYAVKMAAEMLVGSDVLVCTVVGFPQGSSIIDIKTAETRQACLDGATETDMVVNIGKVLSEDWEYVEQEIAAVQDECVKHGAILKVIFENDFLPNDEHKIKLCKICGEIGAAFVKTSTGYGFVKQANGDYNYQGATEHDIKLMRANCPPTVQIKGAGGIRTLDDLLKFREWGVTRVGATATATMLEEAKKRLGLAVGETVTEETIGY